MNIKTLLCGAAMLSVCGVAQAFPDYTLKPEDGKTLDSNQLLATFNLTFAGGLNDIVIPETAMATLDNEDGDEVYSTMFVDFMNSGTVLIKFDEEEIQINGEWNFTIPAGTFTVNGEENPVIKATYSLADPNIGVGDFPQIELISSDPADGSKLPMWGGPDFTQLKLKTSDDAAVNYIEWTLYDVTGGKEEYMRQGNDNRFDFNRYHHNDDVWADGLFVAVGGDTKLVLGRTYRVDLRFCGIGCDPVTKQYPTPVQLDMSTELRTSLTFEGLTPLQEYSKSEYVSVSPDPSEYKITNPDLAFFTVTYSAPAKPVEFTYAVGMGAPSVSAGTFAPADGETLDSKGCATKWRFTFDRELIMQTTGGIFVSIASIGEDGIEVRGNAGFDFGDTLYSMEWECNCGAPSLVSVAPADSSEVESLSSITVSNEKDNKAFVMNYSHMAAQPARICTMTGEEIRVLGEPSFSEDQLSATWEFDPITEEGTYVLMIPENYFNLGEEFEGSISNEASFTYYVYSEQPSEIVYDILPESVSPKDGETGLSVLSTVTLTFGSVTFPAFYGAGEGEPYKASLYLVNEGEETLLEEKMPFDNPASDWFSPTIYDFSFTPMKESGQYKVVIPAGTFCDENYEATAHMSGRVNPEIVLNYVVGPGSGVDAIVEGAETIDVYTLDGVSVLLGADVEAAKELPSGIYVINGKKVVIRR